MCAEPGTLESEKAAFNEQPTGSSIWTVAKGHAAVRGCQDFDSSIYNTQSNRCPFKTRAAGQGSIWEEKSGFLSNFIYSRLVFMPFLDNS